MVMVSVSEVYDLSTVTNKMSLIGIHTPTKELIQKTYPGLCMNSKFFRIVKTDVVLSAVSGTVAITPDMVGDNSVSGIAPEDVLNPILYKAVSNESFSTLEARLNGLLGGTVSELEGSMAVVDNNTVAGMSDEFGAYYSLLSNRDGFRIAPIQDGLSMRGLKPLVFEKWYQSGNNTGGSDLFNVIQEKADLSGNIELSTRSAYGMRGRAHPMPRINTTYVTSLGEAGNGSTRNGMGDGEPYNTQNQMPDVPPVMLACIIMPPCRKTKLFFRMRVTTWIEFTEVRPITEIASFGQMSSAYAPLVYHSDYHEQSRVMDNTTDMVDTKNADIAKIMEGR